jgi:hypothetical protein
MDLQELWTKALKNTEIVRPRVQPISSTADTRLPYIFLAPSEVNSGDTVVRQGEVILTKPSLILPRMFAHLEGFDLEKDLQYGPDTVINFMLLRGVQLPNLKVANSTVQVDVHEGRLEGARSVHAERLHRIEDTATTLLVGTPEAWQFSILIFVALQAQRSADRDVQAILDEWKRRGSLS